MAKAPETTGNARAAVGELADDALLQRIATRDREAFQELYRRHESAAYALAWHIARHRELAAEAVQEALLRVWTSAAQYESGNARAWVLRIVAREAIRCCRQRHRRRREQESEDGVPGEAADAHAASPGEGAERHELLGALREHLGLLTPVHRQVLALYYGGGLSQREIAEALETTQQTVSNKLEDALQRLRKGLAEAGVAAALPLLEGGGLGEALSGGVEPPAELGATVLRHLGSAARTSARTAAKAGAATVWWLCAALTAGGAAAVWLLNPSEPPHAPAEAAETQSVSPDEASPKEAAYPSLPVSWDFTKSPAGPEFRVFSGRWFWAHDEFVNTNVMAAPMEPGLMGVLLPVKLPKAPFRVRIRHTAMLTGQATNGVRWTDSGGMVPYTKYHFKNNLNAPIDEFMYHDYYFFDRFFIHARDDIFYRVGVYETPYPAESLAFVAGNMVAASIEVREISIALWPTNVRKIASDPMAFVKTMKCEIGQVNRYHIMQPFYAPETKPAIIKRTDVPAKP